MNIFVLFCVINKLNSIKHVIIIYLKNHAFDLHEEISIFEQMKKSHRENLLKLCHI